MGKSITSKIEKWAKIISYTLVPIIVGIIGIMINNSIENSKINARYIEIAIEILKDKSSDPALKKYATEIINELSPVELEINTKQMLSTGKASLPDSFMESIVLKDSKINFNQLETSDKINQWIEKNRPIGAIVKKSIGYMGNDFEPPYAVISFEKDSLLIGKHTQWWLFPQTILKAEGFNENGKNSGWWNFYDKRGNYKISRLYDPTRNGKQSLVRSSTNGPMKVGSKGN